MNIYRDIPDNLIHDDERAPDVKPLELDIYKDLDEDERGADHIVNVVKCSMLNCTDDCPVHNNIEDGCPVCGSQITQTATRTHKRKTWCQCGATLLIRCNGRTVAGLSMPKLEYDRLSYMRIVEAHGTDVI